MSTALLPIPLLRRALTSRSLRDDNQKSKSKSKSNSNSNSKCNSSYLNHSAARSSQVGLTFSISSILWARFQSLSSLSRAMALRT